MKHGANALSRWALVLAGALALGACGGGDSASSSSSTVITGSVVKGPVSAASVCAYSLATGVKGAAIGACTATNAQGVYSLPLPSTSGAVLLEAVGGSYVDETTNVRVSVPVGVTFTSVASAAAGTVAAAITPITTLAFNAARAAGTVTSASFTAQATNVLTALGITPTLNVTTATPVTTGTPDGYGQALINFSRLIASGTTLASITLVSQPSQLQAVYRSAANGTSTVVTITPVVTPTVPSVTTSAALGAPMLSFVAPGESLDLSNYTLVGKYTLPVSAIGNQIAAEVSAVTYNTATDSLFIVGDEGTYITQISKRGEVINTMNLPAGLFADPEGISSIGNGQFVVADERVRTASLFTYTGGTTLDAASVKTVKLGTTLGNIGLEGVSFDPLTGGYIFVKELGPLGIFQTSIDFVAGTASNGSATAVNSVNLFDPALANVLDFGDVAALSNVLPVAALDYGHLIVLSNDTGRLLKMDRAGKIYSSLDILQTAAHEGVTFDKQLNMYVTNEAGGGSVAFPQLWVYAPTRSSTVVGLGSNYFLSFSASVTTGTGNIVLSGSGGDIRTIPVTDTAQVSITGSVVRINPTGDLLPGQTYSVQFASGVLRGPGGVATQAVNNASGLVFTTVVDITEPELLTSTPSDNASGITLTSNITLAFNETMLAGTGTFTLSNGAGDIRVINANDTTQVTITGGTVTMNPTANLMLGTAYHVLVSSNALSDASGNRFAGFSDVTRLNFITAAAAPAVAPSLLITEMNSNAAAGDFFEILNFGSAAVDLSGWKWDDDSASSSDAAAATFPVVSIPAGGRLVVVNTTDVAAFRAAWGLNTNVPVVAFTGPGLGQGDAVALFDTTGKVVASFSYKVAAITASDGTVITTAVASAGVAAAPGLHAGPSYGATGANSVSAVWDGVSTSAPAYKAAVAGVAGGFAQPAAATAIGSPGQ